MPGYYQLPRRPHGQRLMAASARPPSDVHPGHLPRGLTLRQMGERLGEQPRLTVDGFIAAPTTAVASRWPARREQPRRAAVPRHLPGVDTRTTRPRWSSGCRADGASRQENLEVRAARLGRSTRPDASPDDRGGGEARRGPAGSPGSSTPVVGVPLQIDATLYYGQDRAVRSELKARSTRRTTRTSDGPAAHAASPTPVGPGSRRR